MFTRIFGTCLSLALIVISVLSTAAEPAHAAGGLSLTMADSPDPVASGGQLTYTLKIANPFTGTIRVCDPPDEFSLKPHCYYEPVGTDATGVVVTDTLPSNVIFQSVSAFNNFSCSLGGAVLTCSNGIILAGDTATITVRVLAPSLPAGGSNVTLTNSASVSPSGSAASVATVVTAPPPPQLTMRTRLQGPTNALANQTVTYQVFVDNLSSLSASNIETLFQTALPAGLVSLTPNGWGCFLPSGFYPRLGIDCQGGSVGPYGTTGWTVSLFFKTTGCGGVSVLLDPNGLIPGLVNLGNATLGVCVS